MIPPDSSHYKERRVELDFIIAKMKELQSHAEMLMEIRSGLLRHRNLLNDAWISEEMEEIDGILKSMDLRIRRLTEELYGIGHDMIRACEES